MSLLTMELLTSGRSPGLISKIAAACRAFRADRDRRIAYRTLAAMEDYLLKDIGISRSEIATVVYGLKMDPDRNQDDPDAIDAQSQQRAP